MLLPFASAAAVRKSGCPILYCLTVKGALSIKARPLSSRCATSVRETPRSIAGSQPHFTLRESYVKRATAA